MFIIELNIFSIYFGSRPLSAVIVGGDHADGGVLPQLCSEKIRELLTGMIPGIHDDQILVIISNVLMGKKMELLINKARTDDQQAGKRKLNDDEAFCQVVPAPQLDEVVQGLHRVESG